MKRFATILFVLALLPALALGAPPKADALAFTATTDGQTIILTPTGVMKIRLQSSGPNVATGMAATVVNGAPEILDWSLIVTFGPAPGPGPNPPPPPPSPPAPSLVDEVKTLAIAEAGKILQKDREHDAAKLAAVYRAIAGRIGTDVTTPDQLILANRYAREIALGATSKTWDGWAKALGVWLDAKTKAGSLKAIADYKPIWLAIADALDASAKGGAK